MPTDALQLSRLHTAVTPQPVARLEGYRLADWERGGSHVRIPRSSLTPILRLADTEGFVQLCEPPDGPELAAFEQEWADACEVGFAIGTSSGTAALMLAYTALGVGPGDEVIAVSHTAVSPL